MDIKVPLYATHKVPEIWVVDLAKNVLHVFFQPQNSYYQQSQKYSSGPVSSSAAPGLVLDLEKVWS
jgi:Uma2 family endonuclease